MTTAELKAAEAWELVAHKPTIFSIVAGREPMPPGQAIDYVQDETGDRDDAVTELLKAAANWLAAKEPGDPHDSFVQDVLDVLNSVRGESLDFATHAAGTIEWRCNDYGAMAMASVPPFTRKDAGVFDDWRRWAQLAFRVITLCRGIVAAAYPEPV
jgi:hypothetical protein